MKSNTDANEIRDKILKGLDLTFKKLVRKKAKEDGEFVFSKNGKIFVVKARDLAPE